MDDDTPPLALPGFDVHHLLGAGATGQVWLAREERTGELVALKRLHDPGDAAGRERLLREAALLTAFRHEHVIRLRALATDDAGAPVLVLDHAAGGSLAALLARRGRLDAGEVVTVAGPLAEALAAAHAAGLVHADVTPANVLFDAAGRPLLADLGVSRLVGERRPVVESTADYLDPAVAAGGHPTAATDVHALAAVCHHMLTGSPPYAGESLVQVLRAAAAGERAPLRALALSAPEELLDAVESGLAHDPDARPAAAAFAAALLAAAPARPVRLRPGQAPDVPPTPGADATAPEAQPARWRRWSAGGSARGAGRGRGAGGPPWGGGSPSWSGAEPDAERDRAAAPGVPRQTHAVHVRLPEPVEPSDPEREELPGLVTRLREGARRRRGALVAVVAGLVVLLGVAAAGLPAAPEAARPLAVAATASERGAAGERLAVQPRTTAEPPSDAVEDGGAVGGPAPAGDGSGAGSEPVVPRAVTGSVTEAADGTSGATAESAGAGVAAGAWDGPEDWRAVVEALDAVRAEAFRRADPDVLADVYAAGSEPLRADRAVVEALTAAGLVVEGAQHEILDVTVLEEVPGRARVRVLDQLPEHRVVDHAGRVLDVRTATEPAPVELELVEGADGWRIASLSRT